MLKQILKKHLINIGGNRIDEKVVVFESDDWGSIRIPSKEYQKQLLNQGLIKETDPFSKFDTLETSDDFTALYDVFRKFKDKDGNYPILTANMVLNNPDFDKIATEKFETYYNEPFTKTYKTSSGSTNAFEVLKEGIELKMIVPQFHCNEHLNVNKWMKFLKAGNERFIFAFNRNCFAIDEINSENRRNNLMASYDYNNQSELEYLKKSITDGLNQFENLFGFKSKTTVAPCYVWDDVIENIFYENKVSNFQGSYLQNCPTEGKKFKKKYHYSGQLNDFGQRYFVRNCLFEPSLAPNADWVSKCLESIDIAFKWGKPAIIGSHRINFVEGLDQTQRNQNLQKLDLLLSKIIKKWPEVKFVSSSDLVKKYT